MGQLTRICDRIERAFPAEGGQQRARPRGPRGRVRGNNRNRGGGRVRGRVPSGQDDGGNRGGVPRGRGGRGGGRRGGGGPKVKEQQPEPQQTPQVFNKPIAVVGDENVSVLEGVYKQQKAQFHSIAKGHTQSVLAALKDAHITEAVSDLVIIVGSNDLINQKGADHCVKGLNSILKYLIEEKIKHAVVLYVVNLPCLAKLADETAKANRMIKELVEDKAWGEKCKLVDLFAETSANPKKAMTPDGYGISEPTASWLINQLTVAGAHLKPQYLKAKRKQELQKELYKQYKEHEANKAMQE